MTRELVAISIFGMLKVLFGRQILEKKGRKTQSRYIVEFSILVAY